MLSLDKKPNLGFEPTDIGFDRPDSYIDNETYFAVKYNWSNLEEKLDYILNDYSNLQKTITENSRSP